MARTINEGEHARKRNDILDAAMQLVLAKGYERMTIQDILAEVRISSGAFYHYFDSKPAVLEALIARILAESAKPLHAIADDLDMTALEKLQAFFDTLDSLRAAHRADVVRIGRAWYSDDNAIVRQKMEQAVLAERGAILSEIVQRGLNERVFTFPHPEQAGEILMALIQGMGNAHARWLFSPEDKRDPIGRVAHIIAMHAATMAAIERVLGAPPNVLRRADAETAQAWIAAMAQTDQP